MVVVVVVMELVVTEMSGTGAGQRLLDLEIQPGRVETWTGHS